VSNSAHPLSGIDRSDGLCHGDLRAWVAWTRRNPAAMDARSPRAPVVAVVPGRLRQCPRCQWSFVLCPPARRTALPAVAPRSTTPRRSAGL